MTDDEIPSVPELRARLATAHARAAGLYRAWADGGRPEHLTSPIGGPKGWRSALYDAYVAANALDDALWALAVRSHRWVAKPACGRYTGEDDVWWYIWRGVLALRWTLNQRRTRPEGWIQSRELAVYAPPVSLVVTLGRLDPMVLLSLMARDDVEIRHVALTGGPELSPWPSP